MIPDFSSATVSINMKDYQKMKRELKNWENTVVGMEEKHEQEVDRLHTQILDMMQKISEQAKAIEALNTELDKDPDQDVTRERKFVVRYLREFADSVEQLAPDEALLIAGVSNTDDGDDACGLCGYGW